ncbi:AAA domain-containing protein [Nocardia asteroides]|uniref:AAA domain-containing protein n=1 Tax=Nocardia asteroides TaxID=1824 RepID=UPI00340C91E1
MASKVAGLGDVLQAKAEVWAKELIQLDARNTLLNFKLTKTMSLDLGQCPDAVAQQLFSGEEVRLSRLFTDQQEYRDACTRTRNVVRRIRGFSEEQGVDVGRLVLGRVSSDGGRRGGARAPIALRAPLLLYPIEIRARTAAENDFTLQVPGEAELNPVLIHCLEREYGVQLNSSVLDALIRDASDLDTAGLITRVFGEIATAASQQGVALELTPLVAVGTCNYAKLPMVDDLMSAAPVLARHPLIVALAGGSLDEIDAAVVGGRFAPGPPDAVPASSDYLVLDADSSQYRAVATALAGHHVIVDGPPGTGKSQTIANVIAAGTAAGLKILFVAEKRAAIEAVTNRLEGIGLGGLVLDLHQTKISGRAVATQLADSFDQLARVPIAQGEELDRDLERNRRKLNDYVEAVHQCRAPWQLSVYQVREALASGRGGVETSIRLRNLAMFTREVRHGVEEDLRRFVDHGGSRLVTKESPWWNARVRTETEAREVLLQLNQVTTDTLRTSQSSMRELVATVGLPEPRDFRGWESTLNLLDDMSHSAAALGRTIFQGPLKEYEFATARWRDRRGLQMKVSWRRRGELIKELRQNATGLTKKAELRAALRKVDDQLQRWQRMSGSDSGPGAIGDFRAVGHQYGKLKGQLAAIAMCADVSLADEQPITDIDKDLQALMSDRDLVVYLPDLNAAWARLQQMGLDALLNEIADRGMDGEQAVALFRHALLRSLDEEFMLTVQAIREFRAETHDDVVARYQRADKDHRDLAVRRILRNVALSAQQVSAAHPAQHTLLRSEAKKKRGHRKIRTLVTEAPEVMLAVRPCWAMSPLVVSQALPAHQLFDLVIFDEASQVQPHDAITSIMRGRRLVLAGDDKQLPPTSFFDRLAADDDTADDNFELRDYESILTTLQPLIANRCRLQWHYRSQDERLIQFSNEEIYAGELVTFPGADTEPPLRLEVVDGRIEPGRNGSAVAEVQRVVELIIDHAERRPHESLGVITLGTPHQKSLDMALRRERAERPDLDEFFAEDRGATHRFFIKSIESVQGDERDAIILSVGVAKTTTGSVNRQGFGVLNREGTERRINVAVTRAKRRMTVVSSFPPGALEPDSRVTGTEMLRRFLETANINGRTETVGRQIPTELNGFEQAILDALTAHKIPVTPQWGVADYRIDFALAHPDQPSRMVLAVEADGDSYHRTHSARDRDRLRQEHLERLGWQFHRVWASAWYTHPERELERIINAWHHAVELADRAPQEAAAVPERTQPIYSTNTEPTLPRPNVPPGYGIDNYTHDQVVAMFLWRMSDGLLLDSEERTRQVRTDLGFKRRGSKIDIRLQKALDDAQRTQQKADAR